jgi:tRNA pseudouridine55 synthase
MEKIQVPMIGVINLDKPAGITSARAVSRVKRLLPRGTKIGHAGTLDPFATGVLLLLVGKATKSCEALMGEPKSYEGTMKLGATTATDDPEAEEVVIADVMRPELEAIRMAVAGFVGEIAQKPPNFSAMKIGGRRAYDLARKGKVFELAARKVRIDAIEIVEWEWPILKIRVDCGRGTYIRALARDLGEVLKTGAYLTELRRTRIGNFRIENSVTLETLNTEGVEKYLTEISL